MKKVVALTQLKEEFINVEINIPYFFTSGDGDDESQLNIYGKIENDKVTIIEEFEDLEVGEIEYVIKIEEIESIETSGYDHFIIAKETHESNEGEFNIAKNKFMEFLKSV